MHIYIYIYAFIYIYIKVNSGIDIDTYVYIYSYMGYIQNNPSEHHSYISITKHQSLQGSFAKETYTLASKHDLYRFNSQQIGADGWV